MSEFKLDRRYSVLMSLQMALLGVITQNLRGITVGWSGKDVLIRVIFEDKPSEEEEEDIRVAGSEAAAALSDGMVIEELIVAGKEKPLKEYGLDCWVYQRKE